MNFSYAPCTVAVAFAAFMCIIESQLERCIISPTGSTGLSVIVDLSLSHIKWASAATYVLLNQAHCIFARLDRIFLSFHNRCCQQKSFYPLLFFRLYPFSMRTFPVTSPPAPFSLASAFLLLATLWSVRNIPPALATKCSWQPSLLDSICICAVLGRDWKRHVQLTTCLSAGLWSQTQTYDASQKQKLAHPF